MQLIPKEIHQEVRHTGGAALIKGATQMGAFSLIINAIWSFISPLPISAEDGMGLMGPPVEVDHDTGEIYVED